MSLESDYSTQPREVSLETFAKCNAACTFCPYPTLDRIGEKMSDALIDKLIGEMSEWEVPFTFCPFKVNEPLLDKRLMPILERIENETIADIRLFTNGQALTWKWIEQINQLDRLKVLWVSLNTHDPLEYARVMGINFETTAKNLDMLHDSDFIHPVVLSRVGYDEAFARYVNSRWPRFTPFLVKRDGWLGHVDPEVDEVPNVPCSRWDELSIMANGIVSLCCMDGTGEYAIGDVNKQTMLKVYQTWRMVRGDKSRSEIEPCNRCTY